MRTATVTAINMLTEKERTLTPLHNWVMVERVQEMQQTKSGLYMPGDDHNSSGSEEAEVVACGPDCPSQLRPGDRVKFVGKAIGFDCDGKHYYTLLDAKPAELKTDTQGNPIGAPYIICVIRREDTLQ